jgi:iron complex outermembrane receptor protein/vitamin B12 transporter
MIPTRFGYFLRSLSVSVLVILALALSAWAQEGASVSGSVVDPLGARVGGASTKLLLDGNVVRDATADSRGDFKFDAVAEGRYQVEVSSPGFQTRTTDPVFVARGANVTIDVALPLGPLEQSVSVTAAATDVLPSQVGAPVTVLDSSMITTLGKPDVLDALRLVPGVSLVQTGARGGVTSIFVRGGNSNFNKVLIDGIPANDIGGSVDLSQFSLAGVDRIEVLRDPNSVVFGSDALSGVVSVISRRGRTRIPEGEFSIDGGNLGTHHESAAAGGTVRRFDYFSEIGNLQTDNDLPNNKYRETTYAGRFGVVLGHNSDLSGTVRWIDSRVGSPNAIDFFGTPDDQFQTSRTMLVGVASQTQISDKWQAAVRFGSWDGRSHFENPTLSGTDVGGLGLGNVVTITGANGYSVTGRAILDFGPFTSDARSARQGVYGETSYQLRPELNIAGGFSVEREQGFSSTDIDGDPTTTRNNRAVWIEGRGTIAHRVSATAGLGYAHNEAFGNAFSPRLSVAASLRQPEATEFWGDTRLTFNAGKGIKAPTIYQTMNSLYVLLQQTPAGQALAASAGIGPVGPERGRNVDVGIEQGLWGNRARVRVAYFDNAFYDLVESVSRNLLPQLGVPVDVAAAVTSANVNSQSFTSKGVETSADAQIGRVRMAASYTHFDATITKSLSSGALTPSFNPAFPGIPIGNFSPLLGQKPFRRPANTGSLFVAYGRGRATVAVSGYFAGKSDDSTFLGGSDANFGNSLLLPNQNLDWGYAKLDLSGSYTVARNLKWYLTVENVLDQHYEPAFGFPALPINLRTGVTIAVGGR